MNNGQSEWKDENRHDWPHVCLELRKIMILEAFEAGLNT